MLLSYPRTIFYPLDVLRTRFQSHDGRDRNLVPKYKDALSAFKKVYHDEGMRGFYRGLFAYNYHSSYQ